MKLCLSPALSPPYCILVTICLPVRLLEGLRREYQQARAAPGYEELEAARRRVLEHDPNRPEESFDLLLYTRKLRILRLRIYSHLSPILNKDFFLRLTHKGFRYPQRRGAGRPVLLSCRPA
ncbi:hypothetical protein GOODEAATRI_003105 [Goodea atripinnis]|uniref:Uncharacterized protein n=1 Tax=Goodea atripinnis TaxID=208336 RepID=A0ABV0P124_9TELE